MKKVLPTGNKMEMKEEIKELLQQNFPAGYVRVLDESHLHKGHKEAAASGGGHYAVLIVSDNFTGKSLQERYRMAYQVLEEKLRQDIHALAIKDFTPDEFKTREKNF